MDTEFYTLDFQIFKEKGSSDTRILYATSFTWPPTLSSKVDRCWRPRRLCEPAQEGRGFHLFSVASVMHLCTWRHWSTSRDLNPKSWTVSNTLNILIPISFQFSSWWQITSWIQFWYNFWIRTFNWSLFWSTQLFI